MYTPRALFSRLFLQSCSLISFSSYRRWLNFSCEISRQFPVPYASAVPGSPTAKYSDRTYSIPDVAPFDLSTPNHGAQTWSGLAGWLVAEIWPFEIFQSARSVVGRSVVSVHSYGSSTVVSKSSATICRGDKLSPTISTPLWTSRKYA